MLKRFVFIALTTAAVVNASAQPAPPPAQDAEQQQQRLRLSNGRLYLDDQLVFKNFSIGQSAFRYLFFYVPARGLYIISNREFDGATQSGMFEGRTLSLRVGEVNFRLESGTPLLGTEPVPAWVKFDPAFHLDVRSVMFGYGDKETMPYAWPEQIRKNRH